MKPNLLWLPLALLTLAGCDKAGPNASDMAGRSVPSTPAKLEVRDFRMSEKDETSGVRYQGRGTLVAKDASLKTGTAQVWLTYKRDPEVAPYFNSRVLLDDGVGTIQTFDNMPKKLDLANGVAWHRGPDIRHYGWATLGYIRVLSARLKLDDGATIQTADKRETAPQFEIRDLSTTEQKGIGYFGTEIRGTLITRDERLSLGSYRVWLSAQKLRNGETETFRTEIVVRDGTGPIEVHLGSKESPPKLTTWRIDGYAPLQPGRVVDSANATAVETEKSGKLAKEALFEIRDFSIEKDALSPTEAFYRGSGSLVPKDEALKVGNYVVYMQAFTGKSETKHEMVSVVRDGVGPLSVSDFIKDTKAQGDFKVNEWRVLGYTRLLPAEIVGEGAVTP